jgi:alpha-L-rhamnosidase
VIEPDFEIGLARVAAHVGTPYGRLAVEWARTGDAASVVVDVPFGVSARLVTAAGPVALPPGRSVHEVGL